MAKNKKREVRSNTLTDTVFGKLKQDARRNKRTIGKQLELIIEEYYTKK